MLGFVVRRLRGRWPLAVAVLLTVLITATALTALTAFTRGVGQEGLRRALTGPEHSRTTVVVTSGQAVSARAKDDEAVRAYAGQVFGRLPVASESVARSRSYGLPGAAAPGRDADLTLLAALGREHVRLLAGAWPRPVTAPAGDPAQPLQAAVPRTALARLGLAESALPAPVRLDDRFGGPPLTVLVTGVYKAADPDSGYWRLDPLGGRELQVASFTTYGPLMVDDTAFTAGGILQNYRGTLLTPDLRTVTTAGARTVRAAADPAGAALKRTTSLQAATELPELLGRLDSGLLVARSTLLVGALQLAVLSAAALLLVSHLMTARQEPERILLTARGASRRRLGVLSAAESLLLALPAAVLAPLLAPPLLRLLGRFGPLGRVRLEVPDTWLVWPAAAGCALACVLLTTLPSALRGASAAVLRRAGRRQALVTGAARSGLDLAVVALAVLCYQQLSHYGGTDTTATGPADGGLGVDPVLVAAPVLALCAGTLLVLRLLPFAARAGGRLAARGRSLGPALFGWQLARRPGRATGPVLLLVLAVSSGVLALGQHAAWSASQRDQAEFATAGGLRITGSSMSPMGQGGRYGSLPGADRLIPVVRQDQPLPGGGTAGLLALDAAKTGERVPLRADLRDGKSMRELFAPLAPGTAGAPAGAPALTLPGAPRRIDLDVTVRTTGTSYAAVSLLLRDRFGATHTTPQATLPTGGDATLRFPLDALTDAPIGSAATPLALAGIDLAYAGDGGPAGDGAELTVRRLAVSDTPDGGAVAVAPGTGGWQTAPPAQPRASGTPVLSPPADGTAGLLRLRYWGGLGTERGVHALLFPAPAAPPATPVPAVATTGYLRSLGAAAGDTVHITVDGVSVPLRITAAVEALPVAGRTALAVDLRTLGRFLMETAGQQPPTPTEWWLPATSAADPLPARAAEKLREGVRTEHVQLSGEITAGLLDDPLSAGPQSALAALAAACAVLAAIGFATATAAERRVRGREFSVLLALGTPRRSLARAAAAEGGVLVLLGTAVGTGLGVALVHLMAPLVVLTPAAHRPFPPVRVDMPLGQTLLTAAAIAAVPLLSAASGGPRGRDIAARLRPVEEM
ncbi:FtsX-like permease family protein [Streptomyces sp. Ag109_G2-6]|uniref:FtsX-like permease family protein n=1 Tax=Streptomyces sp. Ag109_G2-6 TaxID=2485154 RepID=UPI000F5095F4|nr:FtsX-like permease family protein [Streptomyces sp. Ag109_G2-6]RPF29726.1 FtsX-like permease family protein [Streptomyces sp. Ag109_G2-6]